MSSQNIIIFETREIIKGNIEYTRELMEKRLEAKYAAPELFVEDSDIRKMFYLMDEIDILCMRCFFKTVDTDFSKQDLIVHEDMKIVIDAITSPENRNALRKWYNKRDKINDAADDFKKYLQRLTGEKF